MKIEHLGSKRFCIKEKNYYFLINTYPFKIFRFDSYESLLKFNHSYKEESRTLTPTDQPNYFSLELIFSTACNLACTYCYAREKNTGCYGIKPQNMDKITVKRAIEFSFCRLVENLKNNESKKGVFDLYFMGGEPLLNKRSLFIAMDFITKKKNQLRETLGVNILLQPVISTNGVLIDDETAKFFKKYKFTYVGVTIDGEKHDLFRKFPTGRGTLKEVLKGVKFLVKNKVNLKLLSVVPPGGVRNIDKNLSFFQSLNILSSACRVSIVPRAPAINELHRVCSVPQPFVSKMLKTKESIRYSEREKRIFANKIIEISKKFNVDERDLRRKITELIYRGGSMYHCPAALWKISITPDGSIYPCHQLVNIKVNYG